MRPSPTPPTRATNAIFYNKIALNKVIIINDNGDDDN